MNTRRRSLELAEQIARAQLPDLEAARNRLKERQRGDQDAERVKHNQPAQDPPVPPGAAGVAGR